MTSEAGVGGNAGSLKISNLADHNDIRGLAQNGSESSRKGHPDLRVHLHLVNTIHLIFDRLFHRDDFPIRFVDVVKAGVERTGLARAGRARHQQNSIGQFDEVLECLLVITQKSQLRKPQHQARFVEHAHDNAFAMIRGNG